MKRRILSLLLCACIVLSMLPATVLAADSTAATTARAAASGELVDEYGFTHSIPDDFNANDGKHPYGNENGELVNLSPMKEIGLLESASANYYSRVYNFDKNSILKGESGGVFGSEAKYYLGTSKNFTTATAMSTQVKSSGSPLECVSGVAWDPTGSGRDDYIAYYGTTRKQNNNTSTYNMELYSFKASGNSMGNAVWKGAGNGAYKWVDTTTRYNAEGYTAIVAGDFDADGRDTLIFYDAAISDIKLKEFSVPGGASVAFDLGNSDILKKYFGYTLNQIQAFNTSQARDTAMVQLEAGNIDGDDAEELIVTVSLSNLYGEESSMTKTNDRSSVVMIFDKVNGTWTCTWSDQISNVYIAEKKNSYCVQNNGGWYMRAASSRIGDIDGDGEPEILVVGVGSDDHNNDDNFYTSGYIAVIIKRNGTAYGIETTTARHDGGSGQADTALVGYWLPKDSEVNNDWVGDKEPYLEYLCPTSLGIVRFDGLKSQPYVVVRGLIFKFSGNTFSMARMQDNSLDDMFHCRYIMRQPIVGNFDGNAQGREQILFVLSTGDSNDVEIGGWYYTGASGTSVMDGTGLRSCNWETNAYIAPEVVLTAPDADTNDGLIARYTGKAYTYTQPELMAILEASPYFEDLMDEYSETLGSTKFGTGKGSGSGTSTTSSTRAGAYVSFEQNFSLFGVADLGSVEAEAAFESEWSQNVEKEITWTYEMEFDAGRESNRVVLIYTPVIVYSYDVYNAATGKWESMDITSAQQPVYISMSVEDYNEAARLRGDPTIGSDIVSAVPGQPTTYRTSTAGLTNAVSMNNWMRTGTGMSTTTQTITKETSSTLTTELTHSIDTKIGAGAGGFTVGASWGTTTGSGKSTTNTTSLTRSGTVADVPTGFSDYSFEWQFICWDTTFGTGENQYRVPVLSYLVRNVQQPPSLPQNVSAVPESDSVTLTWDAGFNSAAEYEIFRYLPTDSSGKHYYKIGTVDGSISEFTHTGLQSGTEYQYVLRAVGADERVSNYTEPVAVVTATSEGAPTIKNQTTGTVSVLPGGTASFSVTAIPVGDQGLSFSWQSRAKGQIAWKTLANEDKNTLTISNATTDMDGTEYRCMVSELGSGSSAVFIYSEAVKLSVGKADATVALTAKDAGGNPTTSGSADYSTETTGSEQQTVTARYDVTVGGQTVSYEKYSNTYTTTSASISDVYRTQEGTYYLLNGLNVASDPDENGVYTGTATSATALTTLSDCLTDNSGMIVAYLGDLHGTVQETETFDGVTYNVFTATGVAVGEGDTLDQTTLTLYQEADGSDSGYYTASYQKVGETDELKLTLSSTALNPRDSYEQLNGTTAYENNTYLAGTLQASWSDTQTGTETADDVTYNIYAIGTGTERVYEKDGTYYQKQVTTEGEGEASTTTATYTALTTQTYGTDGLYGVVTGDAVSSIVQLGDAETTTIQVQTTVVEQKPGNAVTLAVSISAAEGADKSGTVTFQITNTTTGVSTTQMVNADADGQARLTWIPSTAGVYTIKATYAGSTTATAAATNTITYYALENPDATTGYDIELPAAPQYGDTVTAKLIAWSDSGGTREEKAVEASAVKASRYVTEEDFTGYKEVSNWTNGQTLVPGDYLITITVGSTTVSKSLTVAKRAVTVTAPKINNDNKLSLDEVTSGGFVLSSHLKDITVSVSLTGDYGDSANGYEKLFALTGGPQEKTGNYDIYVGYAENSETQQVDFLSKYIPTFVKSVVTVTTDSYTVTFSPGANGGLKAYNITDSSQPFASGASIARNSGLFFTAVPDSGFAVSKWLVDGDEVTSDTQGVTINGSDLSIAALTRDITVSVEFSNQVHQLTFSATGGGSVTAAQLGTTLSSPANVTGGSSITFTAVPDYGKVVASWSVSTGSGAAQVQTNPDGSAFTGNTLTLENISADTVVTVTFEPSSTHKVTYSAYDPAHPTQSVTGVTLTAEGLDETGCAQKGSSVTLTASVTPGNAITEWQIKDGDTWNTVAAAQNSYTIYSLQADTEIRVLVTTGGYAYSVDFAVVDESGAAANGAGTLTAKNAGQTISTGATCTAYTSLHFAYAGVDSYEVVKWLVNDTSVQQGLDKLTYDIDSLSGDTTVKVIVRKKPQLSFTQTELTVSGTVNGSEVAALTNGAFVDFGSAITVTATPDDNHVVINLCDTAVNDGKANGAQSKTFENVTTDQTITAELTEKPAVTVASGIENGAVTFTGTKNGQQVTETSADKHVDFGSTVTITATPESGYVVNTITAGGSAVLTNTDKSNGRKAKENVAVPDAGLAVTADFLAKPTVSIGTATGGTVEVKGTKDGTSTTINSGNYVDFGTGLTVTLKPSTGYEVGTITGQSPVYTDEAHSDEKSYTISDVQADQTITPVWTEIPQYAVTYSVVDTNGIAPGGTNGTLSASVTRKGLEAYKVDSFSTGGNVYRDSTVAFTAAPDSGYRVKEWTVNGEVYKTDGTTYVGKTLTLRNLSEAETVTVQFMEVGNKVTVTAGTNGSITSAKVGGTEQLENIASGFTLSAGAAVAITAQPDAGYEVAYWSVNGEEQANSSSNTFTYTAETEGVGAAITVTFRQVEYPVTWGGANGTVTASGHAGTSASIRGGTSVTFTAAPSNGYVVGGWTVNGETQTGQAGNTFTWTVPNGMAADPQVSSYEVKAVFERGKYAVTVTQPAHGTITADAADLSAVTGDTQVTFTAAPADGYILIGWKVDGTTTNTRSLTHTVTVTKNTAVTAVLVSSHYEVNCVAGGETVGSTVTVSGSEATSANVAYGDSVTFTAEPAPYYHVSGWKVDDVLQNGTANKNTFTLTNVTAAHTVTAVFEGAIRYEVRYKANENGTLSATNNDTALTLTPEQTANVWGGSKLVFTAVPETGATNYMVAKWTVNGTEVTRDNMAALGVTMDHYLSNTLTVESLSKAMNIQVSFETYAGYTIPTSGTGYTVDSVTRNPADTYAGADEGQIRKNGDLSFTISPDSANEYSTISSIKLGAKELLTDDPNDNITVVKNSNGSYTVTVTGVQSDLDLTVTAHKLVITSGLASYTPPATLTDKGLDSSEKIQTTLETKLTGSSENRAYYDIALKYHNGSNWVEVTEANFPTNGVDVVLPYPAGTDSKDSFTIVHMLTTSGRAGEMETVTYTKQADGLHFHVTSLSPFGISWTKYVAPVVGGGGGGAAAPAQAVVILPSANGSVTVSDSKPAKGSTVTLTVTPAEGYALEKLTVTDGNGKEIELSEVDGNYSFTMPSGTVEVRAIFVKDVCDGGEDCPIHAFTDLSADAWYHEAVDYVLDNGLMGGYGNGNFGPNDTLSRAQLAQILYNKEGRPAVSNNGAFNDVPGSMWCADAVTWANANGIVGGYGNGSFGPNDPITREQLAVMLWRYAGSPTSSHSLEQFTDEDRISGYAREAMRWANENGIVNGFGNGLLGPQGNATRAQVAQMLMNFLRNLNP